jgi:lysophospholipase L1-like esterase
MHIKTILLKQIIFKISISFILINCLSINIMAAGIYDTSRIFNVMAKARRGEPITIGVIGGSITAGFAASTESKRWANLMTDWWKNTFGSSKVTLINAGFGGTGTAIADFRVQNDLLKFNPDFVIIEFAVNDTLDSLSTETMEGLVRQILSSSHNPAVMIVNFMLLNGKSAINYHKPVADHYKLPFINFSSHIYTQLALDKKALDSIYKDDTHPNDAGMNYIALFVTNELDGIYLKLPKDDKIQVPYTSLPPVYSSEVYAHTSKYDNTSIKPLLNSGWVNTETGWSSDKVGAELNFSIEGKAIGILYNLHCIYNWGKAEIWVDKEPHKIVDAFWSQTWGPATVFCQIAGNLGSGFHTLHIKIRPDCSNGKDGHYFPLLNILSAGNNN